MTGRVNDDLESIFYDRYLKQLHFFQKLHCRGDFAPITAYENRKNQIKAAGSIEESLKEDPGAAEMVKLMEDRFYPELVYSKINSYAIFYHGCYTASEKTAPPAETLGEANCIAVMLKNSRNDSGMMIQPYTLDDGAVIYDSVMFVEQ